MLSIYTIYIKYDTHSNTKTQNINIKLGAIVTATKEMVPLIIKGTVVMVNMITEMRIPS